MAEFKLKRLKYNWKGSWTASTEYYNDDVVRLGAYIYVCVAPHVANADFYQDLNFLNNEIPPSVEPRWVVMVESVSWQGPWTENTYYTRGALVKQGAVVYLCVEEHTSAATESDFVGNYVDDSYWIIYSQSEQWTRVQMPTGSCVKQRCANRAQRRFGQVGNCLLQFELARRLDR